jgi:hypothetical protein
VNLLDFYTPENVDYFPGMRVNRPDLARERQVQHTDQQSAQDGHALYCQTLLIEWGTISGRPSRDYIDPAWIAAAERGQVANKLKPGYLDYMPVMDSAANIARKIGAESVLLGRFGLTVG